MADDWGCLSRHHFLITNTGAQSFGLTIDLHYRALALA